MKPCAVIIFSHLLCNEFVWRLLFDRKLLSPYRTWRRAWISWRRIKRCDTFCPRCSLSATFWTAQTWDSHTQTHTGLIVDDVYSLQAKGFDLNYLEKVPEVKDTVHKQSLLHHVCCIVVENFPESSDLYSEIGALTRSAKVRHTLTNHLNKTCERIVFSKSTLQRHTENLTAMLTSEFWLHLQVDFDQLHANLTQMEWRCKASWDHLKVIAKHEMKPALKQKMSDFVKDCAERIIILKTVHRRIMNRWSDSEWVLHHLTPDFHQLQYVIEDLHWKSVCLQVSLISAVPGSAVIQCSWHQRQSLQQDHQWVRSGVQNHTWTSSSTQTETSRSQREKQDARQNDHRR